MLLIFGIRKTKIICHFGLFFFKFSLEYGWSRQKKKKKPRIGKMLTPCETPHCDTGVSGRGGEAPWSKPCCSCLLPHIMDGLREEWKAGKNTVQSVLERWSDITAIATLFSKTYWWQDFKSRRKLWLFRTEIFCCYFETINFQ